MMRISWAPLRGLRCPGGLAGWYVIESERLLSGPFESAVEALQALAALQEARHACEGAR